MIKNNDDQANLSESPPNLNQRYASQEKGASYITVRRPVPFMQLGVDSKPYKANTRKRRKQMEQDQRRLMVNDAFCRMNKLEKIYLKTGFQHRPKNSTPQLVIPVPNEYLRAMERHSSMHKSTGLKGVLPKKQNFVEDGRNIMGQYRHLESPLKPAKSNMRRHMVDSEAEMASEAK